MSTFFCNICNNTIDSNKWWHYEEEDLDICSECFKNRLEGESITEAHLDHIWTTHTNEGRSPSNPICCTRCRSAEEGINYTVYRNVGIKACPVCGKSPLTEYCEDCMENCTMYSEEDGEYKRVRSLKNFDKEEYKLVKRGMYLCPNCEQRAPKPPYKCHSCEKIGAHRLYKSLAIILCEKCSWGWFIEKFKYTTTHIYYHSIP